MRARICTLMERPALPCKFVSFLIMLWLHAQIRKIGCPVNEKNELLTRNTHTM